jgi:hypothetical protein
MPVLGESGVVGNRIVEVQATEAPVRQVEMHFLAQPSLGSNTEAVTDLRHAHHQLGIDRWPACVTVIRRKVLAKFVEIEVAIDAAKQVLARHLIIEAEGVKQSILNLVSLTQHGVAFSVQCPST